jgi:hypothetical protein
VSASRHDRFSLHKLGRRIAESILSDFNDLRRHFRVIANPKPPALSGPAATLDFATAFRGRPNLFKRLSAKTCHKEPFPPYAEAVDARRRCEDEPGLVRLSEKTIHGPSWLGKKLSIFLNQRPSPQPGAP